MLIVMLQINYRISDIIKEFQYYSLCSWARLLGSLFLLVFIFNLLGIGNAYMEYKISKSNTTASAGKGTSAAPLPLPHLLAIAIIVSAFLLVFTYLFGLSQEQHRTAFKLIQESSDEQSTDDIVFSFDDNRSYLLYAVVFENADIYIVCPLCKTDTGISLNTRCQKVIPKDNIMTFKVDNIYKISYVK